ncbi:hypothetical protein LJC71_07650 [Desulfosarcina sp. OttesenSCG-928-A07]|nr:hypothetical protein [Desulfosarcina sp. OttesenSCG-928-G17]MDL2329600.1 hypothetical protein [Desulfosarcina sp. OttesenSCG-928-A07]
MSFKENLLKKITINRLAESIAGEIGPVESGKRIDKNRLQQLMTFFPWSHRKERDLDLYIENELPGNKNILVLDNDLTLYHTRVEDVILRKSPTVKEMISIRNAIKILNDKDVVVSRKAKSLETIRSICINQLNFSHTDADIVDIAQEGIMAFKINDNNGVAESLMLLAELLHLSPAPRAFMVDHFDLYGQVTEKSGEEIEFGPLVMFSRPNHTLIAVERVFSSRDKNRLATLKAMAAEKTEAAISGTSVFELMQAKALAAETR